MKKHVLILIFCFHVFPGFGLDDCMKSERADNPSGFIHITVISNIDKQFFQYSLKQQCLSNIEESVTEYAHSTSISRINIPVKEFKCTNKSVLKDFLKLLEVEKYPYLEIDIPDISDIKYDTDDSVLLKGVTITVAGISNQYDIKCKIDRADDGNQIFNGAAGVKLTDFNIVPPVRLLGLVKVKDEIFIDFKFCLKSEYKSQAYKPHSAD